MNQCANVQMTVLNGCYVKNFAAFARKKEQQRIMVDFFTAKTQSTQRKCTNVPMHQCENVKMYKCTNESIIRLTMINEKILF